MDRAGGEAGNLCRTEGFLDPDSEISPRFACLGHLPNGIKAHDRSRITRMAFALGRSAPPFFDQAFNT